MEIDTATKVCPNCGETKNLSEFHRNKASSDGRVYRCAACANNAIRKSYVKTRAAMGEEQWLKDRRQAQQTRRAKLKVQTGSTQEPYTVAYGLAAHRLRRLHPSDFKALLREERYKLGLDPDTR